MREHSPQLSPISSLLAPWVAWLLPTRTLPPQEHFQLRLLIGGTLLGVAVAIPSLFVALAGRQLGPALVIGTFGAGCMGLLALARTGASLTTLRRIAFALVGGFLVVECLQPAILDWGTLKWLVLLPLLSSFLSGAAAAGPGARAAGHQARGLWTGTGWAIVLACFIVFANRMGWTAGVRDPLPQSSAAAIAPLVDFALYAITLAGLMSIHGRELRRMEAELRELQELLSMCAWCRRIRDDEEGWVVVEHYLKKHTSTRLTHGICPSCAVKVEAELR